MKAYSVFSYDKIEIYSGIHASKCILRQQAGWTKNRRWHFFIKQYNLRDM